MSDKKESMFAKLAAQNAKVVQEDAEASPESPDRVTPPSPALPEVAKPKPAPAKKKPEPVKGKRENPDYCQANAYVLKSVRKSVDKALLDIDGLDYSTLVEDLLKKWLKTRGLAE